MPHAITIGKKIKLLGRKTTELVPLLFIQILKTEIIGMAGNHLLVKEQIRPRTDDRYLPLPEAICQLF